MRPSLSFEQYRSLDLFFFTVITFLAELGITLAASKWFPDQLYTVSVTAAITAIVIMRWKGFAMIQAVVGALALCLGMGAEPKQILIYCLGNLFSAGAILVRKAAGEKRIRENVIWTLCFGAGTLFLMQTGRVVMALLLGSKLREVIAFYATDSLSYIFTAVILWIARRQDGIFEDQKAYVLRMQEERELENEEKF